MSLNIDPMNPFYIYENKDGDGGHSISTQMPEETLEIHDGIAVLKQIPDTAYGVTVVDSKNKPMLDRTDTNIQPSELKENEFIVLDRVGFLIFNPARNNEVITVKEYYGKGYWLIDASRIMTELIEHETDGTVSFTTLDELYDKLITQGNYTEAQGDYAKTQGDYAKKQGDTLKDEINKKADKQTQSGGFSAGNSASAQTGGAVGHSAKTSSGGASGSGAVSGAGFAGGVNAKAAIQNSSTGVFSGIDAIQLGTGTNTAAKTMQVYNKRIVESSGSLTDVGSLSGLATSNKGTIVGAVNELHVKSHTHSNKAALDSITSDMMKNLNLQNKVYPIDINKTGSGNNILYITVAGITSYDQLNNQVIRLHTGAYSNTNTAPANIYLNINGLGNKVIMRPITSLQAGYDTKQYYTDLFHSREINRNTVMELAVSGSSVTWMNPTPPIRATSSQLLAGTEDAAYITPKLAKSALDIKADKATTLKGYGITDAYTKNDINNKLSSVYRIRGSVPTIYDLPELEDVEVGDVFNIEKAGTFDWNIRINVGPGLNGSISQGFMLITGQPVVSGKLVVGGEYICDVGGKNVIVEVVEVTPTQAKADYIVGTSFTALTSEDFSKNFTMIHTFIKMVPVNAGDNIVFTNDSNGPWDVLAGIVDLSGYVQKSTHNAAINKLSTEKADKTELVGKKGTGIDAAIFNDITTNKAAGNYSHAEGYSTSAGGIYSHAEGTETSSKSTASHAEGDLTSAEGYASHAEGRSTIAKGAYSHAEGNSNSAIGEAAHAEGDGTQALSDYSHAEGLASKAQGTITHAEGLNTIAISHNGYALNPQHVEGKYNIADTVDEDGYNTYAHIVGNGTSNLNRSNAYTLDWNGNAWFAGKVEPTDYSNFDTHFDGHLQLKFDSKADKQTADGGFTGGQNAIVEWDGAAIGNGAQVTKSDNKYGRGLAGGYQAKAKNGGAAGSLSDTFNGGSVGNAAYSYNGGAVGSGAKTTNGFAGGQDAVCENNGGIIDAIQLGTGKNDSVKTLQVYDYRLMNADGTIPSIRIPALSQKADKQTADGGFIAGQNAKIISGGSGVAIGAEASTEYGASVGNGATSEFGGAIGTSAITASGGSIGDSCESYNGGAIGAASFAHNGGAVGFDAKTSDGFAGGHLAECQDKDGNVIDAIQLGTGKNDTAKTLQVYDYQLMNADGTIPSLRIPALSEKANKQEPNGGFVAGQDAQIIGEGTGTAIGMQAATEYGAAVGSETKSAFGGAVGSTTTTADGGAIGASCESYNGGAIGAASFANDGGAVGFHAKTSDGFAGGYYAECKDAAGEMIDAIQLGEGRNKIPKTMQVYSYRLMDANGKIPADRLPYVSGTAVIENSLTSTSTAAALSANQGKLLNESKVDKIAGKGLSANDYTTAEKTKLSGIATNANNYVHPASHAAGMIAQDSTHRFVSDTEKSTWNGKLAASNIKAGDNVSISTSGNNITISSYSNKAYKTACCVVGHTNGGATEDDCDFLCNGENDTQMLQYALKQCCTDGGKLIILQGTYSITKSLTVSPIIQFGKVIIQGNGAIFSYSSSAGFTMLSVSSEDVDVTIENITFQTDDNNISTGKAIEIVAHNATVQNCTFKRIGTCISMPDNSPGNYRNIISNNMFTKVGHAIDGYTFYTTISNNIFDDFYSAITLTGNNNIISSNQLVSPSRCENGMNVSSANYTLIIGNQINVTMGTACKVKGYAVISGNYIYASGPDGVYSIDTGSSTSGSIVSNGNILSGSVHDSVNALISTGNITL